MSKAEDDMIQQIMRDQNAIDRTIRDAVYSNLNEAQHNSDRFQCHDGVRRPWKQVPPEQIAEDMLDHTTIGELYTDLTIAHLVPHIRKWLDTLP